MRLEISRIHTKQMSGANILSVDIDFNTMAFMSKNYTGSEISAVVRWAISFALEIKVRNVDGNRLVTETDINITIDDMLRALHEVKPAFGVNELEFSIFSKVFYKTENFVKAFGSWKNSNYWALKYKSIQ